MKISYNWLKQYINTDVSPEEISKLLTDCGLEVESMETFESIKGGLQGIVVGEVKTRAQHPNADRLSVTTVDVGTGTDLHVVCGAANVAAGKKVVVATIGATIYPSEGEPFKIKESKIRGELSQGMICAEDELGLGQSHEGIMVLDADAKVGTPAAHYFKIENDIIFEIGLTPNRADAMSHMGVARDLAAVINSSEILKMQTLLKFPLVENFAVDNNTLKILVKVQDPACIRYSGVTISGVEIKESPDWLKMRIKAIGLKSINNIVDVTNFVLHECGQPLHAFDAAEIKGNKVLVKKLPAGTKFTTLDGVERILSGEELMICHAEEGMCIAGIFGGTKSGVKSSTKNIFLESAYFNSVSIRKSSKYHGLKTDASFRFERGTDPNITVYALKRAALLIKEVAGGLISSDIIDIYPEPVQDFIITVNYKKVDRLIGYSINKETIKKIITALGMNIQNETAEGFDLKVPPFKVDIQREADVIEEILRVYGYNNIPISNKLNASLSFSEKPDKEKAKNTVCDYLSSNGFYETMSLSLTKSAYTEYTRSLKAENHVVILNPLSSDLNVLRQSMLFSGLEVISYNKNRKNSDLKIYEFGQTYAKGENGFIETKHLTLFLTGRKNEEEWNNENSSMDFYELKAYVENILNRLGIKNNITLSTFNNDLFSEGLYIKMNDKTLVELGNVQKSVIKQFDINQEVFYADFNWDLIIKSLKKSKTTYTEVSKFPEVRRDLALLLDKQVQYVELEKLAFQTERSLLKKVNLFDVYEGDKIEQGKKSYALSFILQDETKTLNDKQIDKVMERLMETFEKNLNASVRK